MALCLRWPLLACCALLAHPLLILGKVPCQTAACATSPAAPEPRRLDNQMPPFLIPDTHIAVRCTACYAWEEHLVIHGLRPASSYLIYCATLCKTT